MVFFPLLAQAGIPPEMQLNASKAMSEAAQGAWQDTWDTVITPSNALWGALNSLGAFLAVGTLVFWMVDFTRKMLEDESGRPFSELIYPMIVVLLLAGGGANMAALSKTMRGAINYTNNQVFDAAAGQIKLERVMNALGDYSSAQNTIISIRSQCNGLVDPNELKTCLEKAGSRAELMLQAYRQAYPEAISWTTKLSQQIDAVKADPMGNVVAKVSASATNIALMPVMIAVEGLLVAMQTAFQYLIEISMLLTALMGPIAVGTSLLPIGGKPLYLWLTSFWSLGLCKICLNVVSGLVSLAIFKTGATDTLITALTLGLLAPILALGMATGGGMAIFNGISQAAATAAQSGLRVGASFKFIK